MYRYSHIEDLIDALAHRAEDEAQIRSLFRRLADSWNRNDAVAYAEEFTADSDYVAFDGTRLVGRRQNAESHDVLFQSVLKGTHMKGEVDSIRFVNRDVAIVHASGAVLFPWQVDISKRRRSIQTLVAVRRNGRWRISAFHNTRVRPVKLKGISFKLATWLIRARAALSEGRQHATRKTYHA